MSEITKETVDEIKTTNSHLFRTRHLSELRKNKHTNKYLQASYNKHGEENFKWEVIEYVEFNEDKAILKKNLLEREQYWLDYFKVVEEGYNFLPSAGSRLGSPHSQETKNRMVGNKNAKGIKKIFIEEHKRNISYSKKGKPSPRKGVVLSSKTLDKISKSLRGRKPWNKGKPISEEHRQKVIDTRICKKIINKTTNMIFNSLADAERYYGIPHGNICNACKGRCTRAGGYEWGYYNE